MHARSILSALFVTTLTVPAFAQGADLCTAAQVISGTGSFAFNNTAATTDGVPDATCNFFAQPDITNDVWYRWTAPSSGSFTISTCAQTTMDSKIAVLNGSCGGTVLACNDDNCGLQSSLDVIATGGLEYWIRLGNYPGALPNSGTFTITVTGQLAVLDTQVNPTNGHTYHLLSAGSWTNAEGTAQMLGGHLATVENAVENAWIVSTWQNFQGTPHDLWIGYNDAAVEGTFVWADGSTSAYTNWDPGEPNNALTGEDYTNIRRDSLTGNWNDLGNAPTGYFNAVFGVVEIGSGAGTPICFGDGSGTACPCANNSAVGAEIGCLNSFAMGGKLLVSGNASIANDSLVLQGSQMPNSSALYFQGTAPLIGGAGTVFGDGLRCAGGTVIRLGTKANSVGASQYPVGADQSVSVRGLCTPAAMRVYQVWYRNAAVFCSPSTFNLTNGVSVTWNP